MKNMETGISSSIIGNSTIKQAIHADPQLQELCRNDEMRESHDAALYTEALRTAQSAPDQREEKVAALRTKVIAGLYEIDAKAVARALIRDDLSLL